MSILDQITKSRDLLANLALREIRGQYKRTLLGNAWSLLNPIAIMVMYSVVFGLFLGVQPERGDPSGLDIFALWLMTALIPWTFLSRALSSGMGSLVANANLVTKVAFRREVVVTATVLAAAVSFVIELGVLILALVAFGGRPVAWILPALFFATLLMLFAVGLAWVLSVANVYFRDTQHLVELFLTFWFYATPILYPIQYVREFQNQLAEKGYDIPLLGIFQLNPMERFAAVFRALLYDNRWPTLADAIFCLVAAVLSVAAGYAIFRRYEGGLAEEM